MMPFAWFRFWGAPSLDESEPVALESDGALRETVKRDPVAEEEERRKSRDETRRKLGIAPPPVHEPDKACPKCGSMVRSLTLRHRFTYPSWYFRPEVDAGCSVSRGCPEGEHIDVACLTCGHEWPALCLDGNREEPA